MHMIRVFDRILVAVPDIDGAVAQYERLLGVGGHAGEAGDGRPVVRWFLPNTVIELFERAVDAPCLEGIAFNVPGAGPREEAVANSLGIDIRQCDGHSTENARQRHGAAGGESALSVDHVVLRTGDAEACIDLFASRLGIRLALDKTVPEWGGRMLFFRGGKLTLEVIQSDEESAGASVFWGIAYQCADIEAAALRLKDNGVTLSEVRDGRKPGTRVATVKSHCLEIPTLLIQQAST